MDKFRENTNKHRRTSIDGFVKPPQGQRGSIDFRRPQNIQPAQPINAKIDDFRRPAGFQPGQRPVISSQPSSPWAQRQPTPPVRIENLPSAKHHKHKSSKRKVFVRGFATMMVLAIVGGGFIFGKGYLKARNIFKGGAEGAAALQDNVDPSLLKGEGDGRVNIMVLGKGGPGHTGADLTDTVLIASIDPLQKEASLLSIPRDLYVKVPNLGSMRINSVYSNAKERVLSGGKRSSDLQQEAEKAGLDAIQKALEQSMGIPIHYYSMVDFEAFRQAIDTVGGITVDVKEQLYDPSVAWENNNNPLIAARGQQTMNGKKALIYARSRMGSARGDFDRGQRQREIILALKEKVLSAGTFGNPLKISQLTDAFGNHVQTNLNVNEVMRVYNIGKEISSSKITSIGLADPPNNFVTTDMVGGQSVVIPRAGLYNFKEIQNYVRNSLKDGYLRNENANIIVLNGTTTPGLASRRSDELKSFGYNVTQVADAPTKTYNNTIVVDLRNGSKKYTRRYLEQRLGVTAVNNLPDAAIQPGTADFVIILGRNEAL